jgi:hypothetical protein
MMTRSVAAAALACAAMPEAAAFMGAPGMVSARMGAARRVATRPLQSLRATAAAAPSTSVLAGYGDVSNIVLSGLNGMALKDKVFPTKREVEAIMPENTWVRDDKVLILCVCVCVCNVPLD